MIQRINGYIQFGLPYDQSTGLFRGIALSLRPDQCLQTHDRKKNISRVNALVRNGRLGRGTGGRVGSILAVGMPLLPQHHLITHFPEREGGPLFSAKRRGLTKIGSYSYPHRMQPSPDKKKKLMFLFGRGVGGGRRKNAFRRTRNQP